MMITKSAPIAKDASLVAIIQTYNDVTERLKRSHDTLAREVCRLRNDLHEKNRQLQRRERLAALGEMAAGMAHEIRNPLGGIRLFASLLGRDLADRPEQLEIVRKMSGAIWSLESVVSDILVFAGDAQPNRRRVLLATILDAALDQIAPKASALDARVEVEPGLAPVALHCDAAQIERALVNLIVNALEAAGPEGSVWVRRDPSVHTDGLLRVVVEDDGPGITSELRHRIFDPFFTTKDEGTGLGLAIVHRIAESNGGSVSMANRREGGAVFVLSIPLAHGDDSTSCGLQQTRIPARLDIRSSKGL